MKKNANFYLPLSHSEQKKVWNMNISKWLGNSGSFLIIQLQLNAKKIRGRSIILSNYHYRVDPKIVKGVCSIFSITCACKDCVAQIDNKLFKNVLQNLNQDMTMSKTFTIINYLWITMAGISCIFGQKYSTKVIRQH